MVRRRRGNERPASDFTTFVREVHLNLAYIYVIEPRINDPADADPTQNNT